jgi:hypothetical protein
MSYQNPGFYIRPGRTNTLTWRKITGGVHVAKDDVEEEFNNRDIKDC